jgi:L-malate glycosyltransferase
MPISFIISPAPTGSGAHVLHTILQACIPYYKVCAYDPKWTLLPPTLPLLCRPRNADLIHTTPDYAIFFAWPSVPLVVTALHLVMDPFMRAYSSRAQWFHYRTDLKWFTQASLKIADRVTAISQFTADMVKSELHYHRPIRIIYCGIDEQNFRPGLSRPHSGIRVLFSGNLTRRKGFQWLPAIAKRLNRGITIDYTQGLRTSWKESSEPNLKPIGQVSSTHMPDTYRSHDIFLSPTVREGFGFSIAEAMACGLPVVASDCSSIPELVDHGKGGFLCPVGDVEAFAEKINLLADSPRIRKEMGEYNRAKVEKMFTVERMVREYKELFEEVLDTRKRNRH